MSTVFRPGHPPHTLCSPGHELLYSPPPGRQASGFGPGVLPEFRDFSCIMATFESSARLNCSPAALREYLGVPANLPLISDPELELEVLEAPVVIKHDALIDFRISAYGFKQRMQHRYVEVSETEIVAEQTDGPTRAWIHRQTIVDHGDGTCTLKDQIDFEPPGGMLGFVMTEDKIRESIKDGMEFRYETLQDLLQ